MRGRESEKNSLRSPDLMEFHVVSSGAVQCLCPAVLQCKAHVSAQITIFTFSEVLIQEKLGDKR